MIHTSTLRFPTLSTPDSSGFATLSLITRLTGLLDSGARFARACAADPRSSLPALFFFDPMAQRSLTLEHPAERPLFCEAVMAQVGQSQPEGLQAWCALPEALTSVRRILEQSAVHRQVARAVQGFVERLEDLQGTLPECQKILLLLRTADDERLLVIDPESARGTRYSLRGFVQVKQVLQLLAQDTPATVRPGSRYGLDHSVNTSRDLLILPHALSSEGKLPGGFRGTDHWVLQNRLVTSLPREQGELVVLLGESPFLQELDPKPMFPEMESEFMVLERLAPEQVQAWLARRCPRWQSPQGMLRIAA